MGRNKKKIKIALVFLGLLDEPGPGDRTQIRAQTVSHVSSSFIVVCVCVQRPEKNKWFYLSPPYFFG